VRSRIPSLARACLIALSWTAACSLADESANTIPSLAELEAAGAIIGEIRINNQNIFDLEDPKENKLLFRIANWAHVRTRPHVIRSQLLFHSGEKISLRLIEESERLLRANRFIYDISIRTVDFHDGVVDLEVNSRDTWTLQPGVSFSRSGGSNSSGTTLRDYNLLGSGVSAGLSRSSNIDHTTTEYQVSQAHAFDGWTSIEFLESTREDGKRESFSLQRPFYALDTRWAAGFSAAQDNSIDTTFQGSAAVSEVRHKQDNSEVYGGWSDGLIDGWARRYSVGLNYQRDVYTSDPGFAAPAVPPENQTLVTPFLRYEVVEDHYNRVKNFDQIQRPEYLAIGFQSRVQIGRSLRNLGSTRDLWIYSANLSRGYELDNRHTWLTSLALSGQYGYHHGERQQLGGTSRLYSRQNEDALLYFFVGADVVRDPASANQLLLGGDNGLRGYPLRYQSGERRLLLTLEQRLYADWYPFQLFRVGGAVFADVGRAWGGPLVNTANPGWLSDVGFGVRFLSARSAFGNVLHLDFAFPLNRDSEIRSFQWLVSTKTSF
jgi:outer membrane protein assembly factor BamA